MLELAFVFAQLRDVLTAENSAPVPEKDQDRGTGFPQGTKANFLAAGLRQDDVRKLCAEGIDHGLFYRTAEFA